MSIETHSEFIQNNLELIKKFLEEARPHKDEISASIQATMAQFLLNTRIEINECTTGQDWISTENIIQAQITALRGCIINLEQYYSSLMNGERLQ